MKKEKGVYGCIWVFMDILLIIFGNWGILTKRVFLEGGGVYFYFLGVSEGDPVFLERGGVG